MSRTADEGSSGIESTAYTGPVTVSTLRFGGYSVRLARPAEPDRLLDDPGVLAWNRRDDYMPYWAYLWPGAYLLAEVVAREEWHGGGGGNLGAQRAPYDPSAAREEWDGGGGGNLGAQRAPYDPSAARVGEPEGPVSSFPIEALEIGCGLGLAGLLALRRGWRVQFSDYDRAPLAFVARSAAENGFDERRYATRLLDWRNLPDERFPVILGADVTYETRLVPLVANVLATMLSPGGVGLIASPRRVADEGFPAALESLGLNCRAEAATAQAEDDRAIVGTIYRVAR